MNPAVDAYLKRQTRWGDELSALRDVLAASGLEEDLKWGHPCYTLEGRNVALLHGFKAYCAVLFHKGALLKDAGGLLVQQTENVQSARQMRFTSLAEVNARAKRLAAYVREAAALERAGAKVPKKATRDFDVPDALREALAADPKLKKAFAALTPGRQRAYLLHVGQAKLAATRAARVAKHAPRILEGLGLDD